jgi:cytochrome P450
MASVSTFGKPTKAVVVPMRKTLPGLFGNRAKAFERIGRRYGDDVVRLDLGLIRPYLVVSPEHVARVLRDNAANYVREGMFWKPVRRLLGNGLFGEGPAWEHSRRLAQPLFAARTVGALTERMIEVIDGLAADTVRRADEKGRVDASVAMARIVGLTIIRLFFADRVPPADAERIIPAFETVSTKMGARTLLPFVPDSVRLPGDAEFLRAVRTVDDVMIPMIKEVKGGPGAGETDIVARLCQAHRDEGGTGAADEDRRIRDDIVSLYAAGAETTAEALTWTFIMLGAHPDIAKRLYAEIDAVVGSGPLAAHHLPQLRYTKMVLQETLRMYSSGWVIPRQAVADDVIGGVVVKARSTVILSPYLTHRVARVWPDPGVFNPERFAPENAQSRPPFSFIPFGGGPHMCLGSHFFLVEGQMVIASLLSRRRPRFVRRRVPTRPRLMTTVKPPVDVDMVLEPVPAA